MQYDYFVASRYRNKEEVLRLVHALEGKGKKVYSFIETEASTKHVGSVSGDVEEQMKYYEARENWQKDPAIREIFESDMEALRNSDALILLLPAGKSAHVEAGAAYGMDKKCFLIGEQKETESLYLIFDKTYPTIESFLASI
ncbi:MAG TPA: hypothetical protein VLB73_02130 [Patescibacteria group bacterium]|nr:hypothetical protein [Patescibacteria group bacterium]